jgi:hypothetical protein
MYVTDVALSSLVLSFRAAKEVKEESKLGYPEKSSKLTGGNSFKKNYFLEKLNVE